MDNNISPIEGQPTSGNSAPSELQNQSAANAVGEESPVADVSIAKSGGKFKKLFALGTAVVVVLVAVFVSGKIGGNTTVEKGTISLAFDPRGDGSYYSVEFKNGKAVVGGRITSKDLDSIDIRADLKDSESSRQSIVAVDKNSILLKQYPDGSAKLPVEFVKVDLKTMQQTVLFSAPSGASAIYIASEKFLLVTDNNSCFKVDLEGVSSRIGPGYCQVAGGRISVWEYLEDSLRIITVDASGAPGSPIDIALKSNYVDGYSKDQSVVWGHDDNGAVIVFDALKGTQIWKDGSSEKNVSILNSSDNGKSLLVSVDDTIDSDSKVDLAVVRNGDGSPLTTILTSAFTVGGVIAPDGKTALAFTQDQDASSGNLLYFDESLKVSKTVVANVTIKDIGVASNGLAVAFTDSAVYSGSFGSGLEQKANGAFTDFYYNVFSIAGTESLLLNLVGSDSESGGGDNQILYVPAPLAVDGGSNSIVVASGDQNTYLLSSKALSREGTIIFATQSDNYLIFNQRELKKDAVASRLVEGRLMNNFEVKGEKLTYYEDSGSERFTTYQLKGVDVSKREVLSDGYFIYEIPIGDAQQQLEEVKWKFISVTAQIDDDLEACRSNGDEVIKNGDSATVELKYNTSSDYLWTRFCVQNSANGATTNVYTTNSHSYDSGKDLWMRIRCWDKDTNSSYHLDERVIASEGGSGPGGQISNQPNASFSTCEIADNAYHNGYSSIYSNGGNVQVGVSEYDEGSGSGD